MRLRRRNGILNNQSGWGTLLGLMAAGTLAMCFGIVFLMGQRGSSRVSYYGDAMRVRSIAESGIESVTMSMLSTPDQCQTISSSKVTTLLKGNIGDASYVVYGTVVEDNNVDKIKLLSIGEAGSMKAEARRYLVYDSTANTVTLDRWE